MTTETRTRTATTKTVAQAFDSCDRILVEGAAATSARAQADERESMRRLRSSAMVMWAARANGGEENRDPSGVGGSGVLREYAKRCRTYRASAAVNGNDGGDRSHGE